MWEIYSMGVGLVALVLFVHRLTTDRYRKERDASIHDKALPARFLGSFSLSEFVAYWVSFF